MARKRMSSEVDAQPQTTNNMLHGSGHEDKAAAVWEQYNELCRAARLDLPTSNVKSPDRGLKQRSDKLWQAYKHLSWKNPQRLSEEVGNFLSNVAPGQASHGMRLGLLLDTLKTASDETATPKSHKFQKSMESSRAMPAFLESTQPCSTADCFNQASSPSPSPSKVRVQANLKSSFKATKPGASTSSSKPVVKPFRPPSPSTVHKTSERQQQQEQQQQRLLFAAPLKPSLFKQSPPPAQRPTVSDTKPAATTSFGSTVANTSFGQNNSFWSSQATQESFRTDATSFSDAPPVAQPRESTNYGSSLSSTSAEKWLEACKRFESSQKSSSTDKTIRPTTFLSESAASAASNSTKYSTAPTSPLKENSVRPRRALDREFQSSVQASDYGSSIGTTALCDPGNYRFKPIGIFDHDMTDAPALDIVPERAPAIMEEKLSYVKKQSRLPAMHFEPTSSFARLTIPACFEDLPFLVLWEAQRLLQTGKISPDDLAANWNPRDMQTLYDIAGNVQKDFEGAFGDSIDLEKTTFGAGLQYSQSGTGPIFNLVVAAPKQDKSCDLQRRYGADRVLYVDVPSMSKPPQLHKGRDVMARFRDMASEPQAFLGRRWILFVVQPNKETKNSAVSGSNRLVFFAIDELPVGTLFNDIIPYSENSHQPARKLYTRLELCLSRTIAALQFDEADIDFMADDQFATRERDDDTFLDPELRHQKAIIDPESFYNPKTEMSDGCARLSSWAYWQVHKALGMTNARSALQARVAGAKGVWYKDREDFAAFDEQKPPGKHIKLAKSQVKVNRAALTGCNVHTLSFNVVKFNSYAKTSLMHTGFMPILLDRGVPKQVMLDVIRTQVRRETEQFEEAVRGGSRTLRQWMHSQNTMFEERNRQKEMQMRPDGLPESREERIVQLLEAGFDQNSLPYLAREVKLMAQQTFDLKKKSFKIKLERSTTLMGIADPFGCLKPGEVHVNFSSPFVESTGMSWMKLEMDGLIARNPALAPWDIQKVRFVCKKELEHLTDLFIFPTKGRRPLAGMLQGGDYDGDTFWGCWEPKFARFFKNAPCPYEAPAVERFGILKRKETLRHYVKHQSDSEWCKWLGEMAVARLGMNLLGVVTKLHERLVYKTGDLRSWSAIQLVHLHDYLVDADKQGYDFSFEALNEFKKSIDLPSSLPDPAYWQILKAEKNGTDYENEPDNYPVDKTAVVGNIIDEAYFNVVQPVMAESLLRVQAMLTINEKHDSDLTKLYDQILAAAADNPVIGKALGDLKADLKKVREYYKINYKKHSFEDMLKAVRREYDRVQPHDSCDPTMIEWLRTCGGDLSVWDKLKASALARFHHGPYNPGHFIFSVAGGELCELKLSEMGRTRRMCMNQYRMLKLKKERTVELRDDYVSDHGGEEIEDEYAVGDTAYY